MPVCRGERAQAAASRAWQVTEWTAEGALAPSVSWNKQRKQWELHPGTRHGASGAVAETVVSNMTGVVPLLRPSQGPPAPPPTVADAVTWAAEEAASNARRAAELLGPGFSADDVKFVKCSCNHLLRWGAGVEARSGGPDAARRYAERMCVALLGPVPVLGGLGPGRVREVLNNLLKETSATMCEAGAFHGALHLVRTGGADLAGAAAAAAAARALPGRVDPLLEATSVAAVEGWWGALRVSGTATHADALRALLRLAAVGHASVAEGKKLSTSVAGLNALPSEAMACAEKELGVKAGSTRVLDQVRGAIRGAGHQWKAERSHVVPKARDFAVAVAAALDSRVGGTSPGPVRDDEDGSLGAEGGLPDQRRARK